MSHTTLKIVRHDGTMESHCTFSNAFLGAFLVWQELAKKYNISNAVSMSYDEKKAREIWDLAYRDDVSEEDRITMASTFDRILVKREFLPKVIHALRTTHKSIQQNCSILQQAEELEKLVNDKSVMAVGWNHTSVVNTWEDYFNEEAGDYNINRDNRHSYLFENKES